MVTLVKVEGETEDSSDAADVENGLTLFFSSLGARHFRYFKIFSIIKNNVIAFFLSR